VNPGKKSKGGAGHTRPRKVKLQASHVFVSGEKLIAHGHPPGTPGTLAMAVQQLSSADNAGSDPCANDHKNDIAAILCQALPFLAYDESIAVAVYQHRQVKPLAQHPGQRHLFPSRNLRSPDGSVRIGNAGNRRADRACPPGGKLREEI